MEIDFQKIDDFLRDFAVQKDLKAKALNSCQTAIENCDEKAFGKVKLMFDKIQYTVSENKHLSFLRTKVIIQSNGSQVGYYTADFDIDGKIQDDSLIYY